MDKITLIKVKFFPKKRRSGKTGFQSLELQWFRKGWIGKEDAINSELRQ
ncbi:MAG: hypothetical protein ACPL7B_05635 [Candidatus Poribacteria bacterium]